VTVVEKSERLFRSVAAPGSSGFGVGIVLDSLLGYSVGSLNQSSQHRYDSFEYECEYRCTEYEYDCPDERRRSPGCGQRTLEKRKTRRPQLRYNAL